MSTGNDDKASWVTIEANTEGYGKTKRYFQINPPELNGGQYKLRVPIPDDASPEHIKIVQAELGRVASLLIEIGKQRGYNEHVTALTELLKPDERVLLR